MLYEKWLCKKKKDTGVQWEKLSNTQHSISVQMHKVHLRSIFKHLKFHMAFRLMTTGLPGKEQQFLNDQEQYADQLTASLPPSLLSCTSTQAYYLSYRSLLLSVLPAVDTLFAPPVPAPRKTAT